MKNYRTKLCFLLLALILPNFLFGASIKLELQNAELDQNKNYIVYTNEGTQLNIEIADNDDNISQIQIPGIDKFQVVSQSNSRQMSNVNGRSSSQTVYSYGIIPIRAGTFEIGPAMAIQNGQKIESNVLKVIVKTKSPSHTSSSSVNASEAEVICKIFTNKKTVYEKEPFIVTVATYARGPVLQCGQTPPNFPGFISKEIKEGRRKNGTLNGKQFVCVEKDYVLIPMQTGVKEIPPVSAIYTEQVRRRAKRRGFGFFDDDMFDNFFAATKVEEHQTKSNTLKIKVEPLPEQALSADGVGSFNRFTISADKKDASTNEPILVTLELHGKGNFEQISIPKLKLPTCFKYYDSKNSISEDLSNNYHGGSKKFEYIVQATQHGEWEIPAQIFTSFDVEAKQIRSLSTSPIKLIINKSATQSTPTITPTAERQDTDSQNETQTTKFAKDIHFIEEDSAISQRSTRTIPLEIFLLILLLPLLWYNQKSFSSILDKISKRFKIIKGKSQDFTYLTNELVELKKRNNVKTLHQFFLKVLAAKFDVSLENIDEDWIDQALQKHGWRPEKIVQFLEFLSTCASFYFVTGHDSNFDYNEFFKKADYWLLLILNHKN